MRFGRPARNLLLFSLIVVVGYLAAFTSIEYLRHHHGPWQVQFTSNAQGTPEIVVSQPYVKVAKFHILFDGERISASNHSQTVLFDRPLLAIPYGKVIYEDLTSLPGVVTFELFGHEIELLPRTLIVNRKEIPWKTEMNLTLSATNKPVGLAPRK